MRFTYEIFISARTTDARGEPTRDAELARDVHDYLTSRGHTVFLSTLSLERLGIDAYKKAIDDALDVARVLIAVGTSAENLDSQWVRYEWDSFFNDVLSGVKPEGHIFAYVEDVPITRLPRALRQRQVFSHGPDSLENLGNFVRNALGPREVIEEPSGSPRPSKATTPAKTRETEIAVVAAGNAYLDALTSAVDCANSAQGVFRYGLLEDDLSHAVRLAAYRDLYAPDFFDTIEQAQASLESEHTFVIVVTDSSVSGKTLTNLFGSHRAEKGLALITTHQVPNVIIPADRMAAYFVYYLARYTLSFLFPGVRTHQDTRSCVFDRKIRKADLVQSMAARALCDKCRGQLLGQGALQAATRIDALDRLFALSGDMLESPRENGKR